jgi:hypothetical protein
MKILPSETLKNNMAHELVEVAQLVEQRFVIS